VNEQTDSQLLRSYIECRSEAAFAELAGRHVDFVYSAALRMVRDPHLAEDVTQGVFVALAKNAGQLTGRSVLSGWLHRTAQNIAAQTVRTIERRRTREKEAAVMNELLATDSDVSWDHIAPHLDAALGELSEPDRDALLLRYFERKSAREMEQTLGISDEAAQKRVSRAVERLHDFFAKRGVTSGASGLAVVITANAVQAAPAGLVVTISTAAVLTGTTLATTATVTATKAIAMTDFRRPWSPPPLPSWREREFTKPAKPRNCAINFRCSSSTKCRWPSKSSNCRTSEKIPFANSPRYVKKTID
jgi:RNA polymerase sigma factor (sigma-70 family)